MGKKFVETVGLVTLVLVGLFVGSAIVAGITASVLGSTPTTVAVSPPTEATTTVPTTTTIRPATTTTFDVVAVGEAAFITALEANSYEVWLSAPDDVLIDMAYTMCDAMRIARDSGDSLTTFIEDWITAGFIGDYSEELVANSLAIGATASGSLCVDLFDWVQGS